MKITILTVGRVKEKFYQEAIREFEKRLGRYCTLQIIETADEKTPDQASAREMELIKDKEGERLLKHLHDDMYVIALAIEGEQLSSRQLAAKMNQLFVSGNSHLCFVIGGSLGLSGQVLKRAQYQLSFSAMTFPHQLMRVIALEQIYRSFRIIRGEPYHK